MTIQSRIENLSEEKRLLLTLRARKRINYSNQASSLDLHDFDSKEADSPLIKKDVQRLVSFIVRKSGTNVTSSELRKYLQKRLPYYMIPGNFYFIENFPVSPNGKIDQHALHRLALQSSLEKEETADLPRNSVEETLSKIWADVLKVEHVGIHDNFFELGGDSILSIQIISKAKQEGLRLSANQLFQNQTISELATVVDTATEVQAEQGEVRGDLPLTPIQSWFFEHHQVNPDHWNQAVLLQPNSNVTFEIVRTAIRFVFQHHDALRSQFSRSDGTWHQSIIGTSDQIPIARIELENSEQTSSISQWASEIHKSLNLSTGKIFKAIFFESRNNQTNRLLIIIHHLAMDAISWRILMEDLDTACSHLVQEHEIKLPEKTTSFKFWSEKLKSYAQADEIKKELTFWTAEAFKHSTPLPVDHQADIQENTIGSISTVSLSLPVTETEALTSQISDVYHTKITDILLTALMQTYSRWASKKSLVFGLEGHGREDIFEAVDLSRTIGWFTSYFPVFLTLENPSDPGKSIIQVKEQLRAIPNSGLNFGLLRYSCGEPEIHRQMKMLVEPHVCYNYLGQMDDNSSKMKLFTISEAPSGQARSLEHIRPYLLEFNAYIKQAQFHVNCSFSQNFHQTATIESLVSDYKENLMGLIRHCQMPETGGFSPSDFPEAGLDQEGLDNLLDKITN